jgi:uncharacterized protein (DUF433 family)
MLKWGMLVLATHHGSPPEARYPVAMDPKQIVHSDPEILGGTPVFVGTRVPVQALLDFLEGGDTIEEFLDNYPGVSREQAVAFLEEASRALVAKIA